MKIHTSICMSACMYVCIYIHIYIYTCCICAGVYRRTGVRLLRRIHGVGRENLWFRDLCCRRLHKVHEERKNKKNAHKMCTTFKKCVSVSLSVVSTRVCIGLHKIKKTCFCVSESGSGPGAGLRLCLCLQKKKNGKC